MKRIIMHEEGESANFVWDKLKTHHMQLLCDQM